jgi:hypothetical protein
MEVGCGQSRVPMAGDHGRFTLKPRWFMRGISSAFDWDDWQAERPSTAAAKDKSRMERIVAFIGVACFVVGVPSLFASCGKALEIMDLHVRKSSDLRSRNRKAGRTIRRRCRHTPHYRRACRWID